MEDYAQIVEQLAGLKPHKILLTQDCGGHSMPKTADIQGAINALRHVAAHSFGGRPYASPEANKIVGKKAWRRLTGGWLSQAALKSLWEYSVNPRKVAPVVMLRVRVAAAFITDDMQPLDHNANIFWMMQRLLARMSSQAAHVLRHGNTTNGQQLCAQEDIFLEMAWLQYRLIERSGGEAQLHSLVAQGLLPQNTSSREVVKFWVDRWEQRQ